MWWFDIVSFSFAAVFLFVSALPYFVIWLFLHAIWVKLLFFIFVFLTYPWCFLILVATYKKLRKIGLKPCVFNPKKDLKNLYYLEREFFFHNFVSLFRPWFDHYFGLQKIFYRLMGAKIGKNVTFGRDIIIHDLSLIEIQDNVVLGQSCRIVGHLMSNAEEVILGKVVIGENSVVGGHVKIAPNVKIGKNCVIGLNSIILPGVELADNTRVSVLSVVRPPKA